MFFKYIRIILQKSTFVFVISSSIMHIERDRNLAVYSVVSAIGQ